MSIRLCGSIQAQIAQTGNKFRYPLITLQSRFLVHRLHSTSSPAHKCDSKSKSTPPPPSLGFARLEKGLNLTALGAGLAIALVGLIAWQGYANSSSHTHLDSLNNEPLHLSTDVPRVRVYPGMPAEIPPGRPGNLTPDQEAKLRELWARLYQLINPPSRRNSTIEPNGEPPTSLGGSPADSTKKKRRFGSVLGRNKDKNLKDDSDSQSMYSVSSTAAEDKHGSNKEYREAIAKMSPLELREALWEFSKADDPDANLCRYLRARKWDVQNALVMLVSTIHWRKHTVDLDNDVLKFGEETAVEAEGGHPQGTMDRTMGKDFLAQLRMGKSFLHGVDSDGRPICWVRVKLHRGGDQSEKAIERLTVFEIETARFMLRPPIDTAAIVFDMTGFSMANMDYAPVKFMIKVFEANYPESLGQVLVHRAPWVFQGIWRIIRGWLDPVVASKINFTSNVNELSKHIDMSKIPLELGGEEDWEYTYVEPRPGENDLMKDEETRARLEKERQGLVEEYEQLTEEWIRGDSPTQPPELAKKRLAVSQKMHDNYWKLDPYIRARSLYDRVGIIKKGGYIDMYPDSKWGRPDMDVDQQSVESVYYDAVSEQS